MFSGQPVALTDGTLEFYPLAGVNGEASITLLLTDGGRTGRGGIDRGLWGLARPIPRGARFGGSVRFWQRPTAFMARFLRPGALVSTLKPAGEAEGSTAPRRLPSAPTDYPSRLRFRNGQATLKLVPIRRLRTHLLAP